MSIRTVLVLVQGMGSSLLPGCGRKTLSVNNLCETPSTFEGPVTEAKARAQQKGWGWISPSVSSRDSVCLQQHASWYTYMLGVYSHITDLLKQQME